MTTVSKSVWTDVEVDVDIDLSDVLEFIDDASTGEIEKILKAVNPESPEPELCSALTEFDADTVRHLIERANIFGLDDMLDDLEREGVRIGVYLKPKVVTA